MNTPLPFIRPAMPEDLPQLERLLEQSDLSPSGVAPALSSFLVAESDDELAGAVGLEWYDRDALLRSAAVDQRFRGSGLGAALVQRILAHAEERNARAVYLLTTTADRWFPRFGFERTTRDTVPDLVKTSIEFREICPDSAVVMVKRLGSA